MAQKTTLIGLAAASAATSGWHRHSASVHHRVADGERPTTGPHRRSQQGGTGLVVVLACVISGALSAACGDTVTAARPVGPAEIDGPIAWYALDVPDDAGRDRSGHEHNGVPLGFVIKRDGTRGFVAHFDGGALVMPSVLTRDFTVSFWLKTEQTGPNIINWTGGPRIVDADVPGANSIDFGVSVAQDKLSFGVGNPTDGNADANSLRSQRVVVDGTWHHIAVSRNGDSGIFQTFIDGAFDSERQGVPGNLMLPLNTNLGDLGHTSPSSPPLRCDLSDMRFYNRLLPAAAIEFLARP